MSKSLRKECVSCLENICVRWIAKNIEKITELDRGPPKRLRFKNRSIRLVARSAEKLLLQLCKRGLLNDETILLFNRDTVDLMSPVIKDSSVSSHGLKILNEFFLTNLSAINLNHVTLNNLIGCLCDASVKNLTYLNISSTSILCENKLPIVVSLCRFKNLRMLNVSKTEFTSQCLQTVIKYLPCLTHLNLSRTHVKDISPLAPLKDRLECLIMHRVDLTCVESGLRTVLGLEVLYQLELSDAPQDHPSHQPQRPRKCQLNVNLLNTFCKTRTLPCITYLDLSGNIMCLQLDKIRKFIHNHPRLEFLGLASWNTDSEPQLKRIKSLQQEFPEITMTGDCGTTMLLNTLTRYKDRWQYLQSALNHIFESTKFVEEAHPELLAAVLQAMRMHKRRENLILAGTAAVYNLTRSQQGLDLPMDLLNRAIRITLNSMEAFPWNRQLQKNCFLTLCSDSVLQRANFSCKRCCELVFNALITLDDLNVRQMGVALISILAAEISTSDLKELARDRRYIRRLLQYVAEKCLQPEDLMLANGYLFQLTPAGQEEGPVCDATLRFTLSALWNLTDECSESCLAFIEEQGLYVYHRVLRRFDDQDENFKNHVYTKCLGLLNNVAEVTVTRSYLLREELVSFFLEMLDNSNIQISYFAAGILAHLSCESVEVWREKLGCTKDIYVQKLGSAVANWDSPPRDMVAYRSFRPFEKLVLHPESREPVHLWAVWAIHHVLTRKESRYGQLLRQCDQLFSFLRSLSVKSEGNPLLLELTGKLIYIMDNSSVDTPLLLKV